MLEERKESTTLVRKRNGEQEDVIETHVFGMENTLKFPRVCVGKRHTTCIGGFKFWTECRSYVCQLFGECMYKN